MRWYRLYTDILTDEKVLAMDDKTFRFFINLMALASLTDKNGIVTNDINILAKQLRVYPKSAKKMVEVLKNFQMLLENPEGLLIKNWESYQYKSDNSNERVRRFRAQNKDNVTEMKRYIKDDVTENETLLKRNCNGADTDTDTDTDTDNIFSKENNINSKKEKSTKPKEPKKEYAEVVLLTESEYKSLVEKYGSDNTQKYIEKLNNTKLSKGYTYKSDYRTILNWVVDAVNKNNGGTQKTIDEFEPYYGKIPNVYREGEKPNLTGQKLINWNRQVIVNFKQEETQ
jgi:hypothetical protein